MIVELISLRKKPSGCPNCWLCYGGLVADLNGATRVPGLYAAGRCRSVDPGVYTGGFALASTATSGKIAGAAMVDYIKDLPSVELNENEINGLKEKLYAPLKGTGIAPKEVLRAIQGIVYPYEVKYYQIRKIVAECTP